MRAVRWGVIIWQRWLQDPDVMCSSHIWHSSVWNKASKFIYVPIHVLHIITYIHISLLLFFCTDIIPWIATKSCVLCSTTIKNIKEKKEKRKRTKKIEKSVPSLPSQHISYSNIHQSQMNKPTHKPKHLPRTTYSTIWLTPIRVALMTPIRDAPGVPAVGGSSLKSRVSTRGFVAHRHSAG